MAKRVGPSKIRRGHIVKEVSSFEENRAPRTDEIAKILVAVATREGATLNVEVATTLYQAVIELLFRSAIAYGRMKLPPGWGSLELRVLYPHGPKKSVTPFGVGGDDTKRTFYQERRPKLRYEEGAIIKEILGTKPPSQQRERALGDGAVPTVLPDDYLPPKLVDDSVLSPSTEPAMAPDTDTVTNAVTTTFGLQLPKE